jgi:DNA-directed RNA polymerase specialized sigma24 family protein
MLGNLETCFDLGSVVPGAGVQHSDLFAMWLDVKAALRSLPPRDRTIVWLLGQGWTERDVGTKLGVSHQGIHKRYQLILRRLQTTLMGPGAKRTAA